MAAGGGGTVANLQVNVGADVAAALLGFATLQGAINAVVGAVEQFVSSGIQMNAFLESSQLQFKTLTGSAGAAKEQVAQLFDIAAHTPFTFESVTKASRQLEVFGGALLDTRDNLTLLGDSAAATGANIEEVTFWTGRLYADLQGGRPIGEASRWLQRMGVLSAEARTRLEELKDSGAGGNEVWAAYTDSLQRFSGAMHEQERTWAGLTSTMQDQFTLLEGVATRGVFTRLEAQVTHLNAVLGDEHTQQRAAQFGTALALGLDLATNSANTLLAPIGMVVAEMDRAAQAAQDATAHLAGFADVARDIKSLDFAAAVEAAQRALEPIPATMGEIGAQARDSWGDARQAAVQMSDSVGVANRVLGAAQAAGDSAARGYDSARRATEDLRDESLRAANAQQILNQQLVESRIAAGDTGDMISRHLGLGTTEGGMDVLTGGDLSGIDAIMKRQQDAARAAEKAAREQAQAQEKAAREAEAAQRSAAHDAATAARDAARQTEQSWTAAHRAVATTAQQAARVQIEAQQTVVDSMTAMQQQLQASYGNPSGGMFQPGMGGGGGDNTAHIDPSYWTRNLSALDPRNILQPTIVTHINFNAPVYGAADFDQRVKQAAESLDRTGNLNLTRYATR